MFILPFLPLLFSFFLNSNNQLAATQREPERYYKMEIGPADAGGKFEFELISISRKGKEVELQKLEVKTHFRLDLFDESFIILHGKSGRGRIVTQYKLEEGAQRSYRFFGKGEAMIVEFLPKPVGGGPTLSWSEGRRTAPRLTVTVMKKD